MGTWESRQKSKMPLLDLDKVLGERTMKYPYTLPAKFKRMPWMWMFRHGRGFRWIVICQALYLPFVAWPIQKAVCSPENKAEWVKIRADYYHDPFAAPTP